MTPLRCASLCLCFFACGPDASAQLDDAERATTTSAALDATATIQFGADWSVTQTGALVTGGKVNLWYAATRVQDCLGDFNGGPAWTATAHVVVGDAPEQLVWVGGASQNGQTATFTLDREGPVTIWIEVTNRWGCRWFDSNYGENFHFNATTPVAVHFHADWTITTDGSLADAKSLLVDYDVARLPNCRAKYRGFDAWDILAWAAFDGGAASSQPVTRLEAQTRVPTTVAFDVPQGAQQVQLWFFNSDEFGCTAWDSNYGQNYALQLR